MEEIRGEGSQQLSNLVYLSTKQVKQLSKGDKGSRSRCSFGHITGILNLYLVSICATFKDTYPPSPKKLLKMSQVDVTDSSPMIQANDKSSSEHCEAVMPVEMYAEEYNMNHKKRGKAVIFNQEMFDDKSLLRAGSAVDVHTLNKTYGELGFEVAIYTNFKFAKIQDAIIKLTEEDHSDADCLLVTVLTHGGTKTPNSIYAYDCEYNVEELWLPFTADKCLSLAGKPKIFIIQACRGHKSDPGVTLKQGTESCVETDSLVTGYKIPTQADFLIAYSTVEGYLSYRNPDTGSWFIQCLCKQLQEHASTKDFLKILTRTSHQVAIYHESYINIPAMHQRKQVPSFDSMLIRDLYFRPKII